MRKSNLQEIALDNSTDAPSLIARTKKEAINILESGGKVLNLHEFNDSFPVMYSAVKKDGRKLSLCSDRLKKNKKLVYAAILSYGGAIYFAHPMYMQDQVAIKYAFINGEGDLSLQDFDERFSKDYTIAFFAAKDKEKELENVDSSLRNDKGFMDAINSEHSHTHRFTKKVV